MDDWAWLMYVAGAAVLMLNFGLLVALLECFIFPSNAPSRTPERPKESQKD